MNGATTTKSLWYLLPGSRPVRAAEAGAGAAAATHWAYEGVRKWRPIAELAGSVDRAQDLAAADPRRAAVESRFRFGA